MSISITDNLAAQNPKFTINQKGGQRVVLYLVSGLDPTQDPVTAAAIGGRRRNRPGHARHTARLTRMTRPWACARRCWSSSRSRGTAARRCWPG